MLHSTGPMTDDPLPASPAPGQLPPERHRSSASPLTWIIALSLAAMVGALLFVGGYLAAGSSPATGCAAPNEAFEAFCEAYDKLQAQYVDELDAEELAEGAIRGMFEYGVADPFSGYMPPESYRSALDDLSGTFSGIGAEMAVDNLADPGNLEGCAQFTQDCALVVVAPLQDSPAERAGLLAGDVVRAVDGESVNGSTLDDQVAKVRGETGTEVVLTIERDGETFDVAITREQIQLREVTSRMLDDGTTGYVGLHGFSEAAADQFSDALEELIDDGATAIVFDLRDNPGGYIEAARKVASQFIEDGLLFTQESASDGVKRWESTGDGVATDPELPVAVIINGGSASASEIVAAALKERGRATVVGQPTFGKNTVQLWNELENGGGVRITISRWFTPEHNSVAPDGVQPDVAVEVPDGTPAERDLYLEAAVEVLTNRAVGAPSASVPASDRPAAPAGFRPAWDPISYDAGGRTSALA